MPYHYYGVKKEDLSYDIPIVGFQHVLEQASGVKPVWENGEAGCGVWSEFDKRKRVLETKIPLQSIVQRVVIQYDKHSLRLFGVQLFDKQGALLVSAGLNRPSFSYSGIQEIILDEGERLIGARSVMDSPETNQQCRHFQFLVASQLKWRLSSAK